MSQKLTPLFRTKSSHLNFMRFIFNWYGGAIRTAQNWFLFFPEKVTKRDTIGASKIPELKKMMTLGLDNSEEALLRACKYLSSSENRSDLSDDALLSLYRISSVSINRHA